MRKKNFFSIICFNSFKLSNGDTNIRVNNRNLLISIYSLKTYIVGTVYQLD